MSTTPDWSEESDIFADIQAGLKAARAASSFAPHVYIFTPEQYDMIVLQAKRKHYFSHLTYRKSELYGYLNRARRFLIEAYYELKAALISRGH